MLNFCTLFDSRYLTRGLALCESLSLVCPSFHLYVVSFDKDSYDYLVDFKLPNLTPISMNDFEDQALIAIKPTRSAAEYCWTCTPSVILYCIEKFKLPACTYVDADMIFYDNPQILLDEMSYKSILISEHRYGPEYYKSAITHGIYCVQFMCFRNDPAGMTALRWWRERCLEWCYDRLEDGKFGDQKYLDDWTTRFEGVHVMLHPGAGVAPWNVEQYVLTTNANRIFVKPVTDDRSYPLVFYHFHGLKFYTNRMASCSGTQFDLGQRVKELIYIPYFLKLVELEKRLQQKGVRFNVNGAMHPAPAKPRILAGFIKELLLMFWLGRISPFRLKNYNFARHYHYYNLDLLNQDHGLPD